MALSKDYNGLIRKMKSNIDISQYNALKSVNKIALLLYFNTGGMLSQKVENAKWGSKILKQLSSDIQIAYPGIRGFAYRSQMKMIQFYEIYKDLPECQILIGENFSLQNLDLNLLNQENSIVQLPTAQLEKHDKSLNINDKQIGQLPTAQLERDENSIGQLPTVQLENSIVPLSTAQLEKMDKSLNINDKQIVQLSTAQLESNYFIELFLSIGFTQHLLLIQKCKDLKERIFYMSKSAQNQWTVALLEYHIKSNLYDEKGKFEHNFDITLPIEMKAHALQAFKDEYLLDYLNVNEDDEESVFENAIVNNIKQFMMSLGNEYSFMGNQYRLVVDDSEFFVDLLFYNRNLQALVAIELKTKKFKPEYAGKMNFYLRALDKLVKLPHENPSIGIILCREKSKTIVEFAFHDVNKPMGVATYDLSTKLPEKYKNHLPDPEDLKQLFDEGVS